MKIDNMALGRTIGALGLWILCLLIAKTKCETAVDQLCNELLPDDYKIYRAPSNNENPIKVFVGYQVLDIGEINEENMDFHLHTFVINIWNDSRLLLEPYLKKSSFLYEKCLKYIWKPDIFFETAKRIETFESTSPTTLVKVLPDGALFAATRYSFKSSCNMKLGHYPFDTQRCMFLIAMMSSSDSVARLRWAGEADSPYKDTVDSIIIMREIQPLQFYLLQPETFELTEDYAVGNFTSLIASFTLVRRLTGSIVNTFAPSTVIVAMSWISFWLNVDAVPARVALGVTSLLTLCTQAQHYKTELPPVNYIIAMDIWLFVCIIMVFSTLLEFAVAYNLLRRKCKECQEKLLMKKSEKPVSNTSNNSDFKKINSWIKGEDNQIKFMKIKENSFTREGMYKECTKCAALQQSAHHVDKLCRRFFPGFFLIFAIVYWIYYMRIHRNQMSYF